MMCVWSTDCNKKDCEKDFCIRKYKLDALYTNSLLDDWQWSKQKLVVDSDKAYSDLVAFKQLQQIEADIAKFVTNKQNLFIYSAQCGNGKTSWAIRLLQAYLNSVWPKAGLDCTGLFISVPRLLVASKSFINGQHSDPYFTAIVSGLQTASLVVWDDIAAKNGTAYELDQVLLPLLEQCRAKTNIYTSNLFGKDLYNALGERIASRICTASTQIEFKGRDKRGLAVKR